jgi:hypothetical protein
MLLIENTEPCVRTVGPIILIPGMNRIDPDQWEALQGDYGKPVDDLIDQGVLALNKTTKPTVAIVKKTYSIKLLQEWLDDAKNAKGPVRKAIVDQLKLLTDPPKNKHEEDDGDSTGDA